MPAKRREFAEAMRRRNRFNRIYRMRQRIADLEVAGEVLERSRKGWIS
jgi:hypothetical protein